MTRFIISAIYRILVVALFYFNFPKKRAAEINSAVTRDSYVML